MAARLFLVNGDANAIGANANAIGVGVLSSRAQDWTPVLVRLLAAHRAAWPGAPARYRIGVLRHPSDLLDVSWDDNGQVAVESVRDRAGTSAPLRAGFRDNNGDMRLLIGHADGEVEAGHPAFDEDRGARQFCQDVSAMAARGGFGGHAN